MNRISIAFFVLLICNCLSIRSQGVLGIFLSAEDFRNGKLSFSKTQDSKCKIKVHSGSTRKKIYIKCGKESIFLSKDSVYGYKDNGGLIYRFYKGVDYNLINPEEEIQLYEIQVSGPTKYEPPVVNYYFSANSSGPLYALNIYNVLSVFSHNQRFCELVELRFRYDSELLEFDSYHKKYKLNRLLELSTK